MPVLRGGFEVGGAEEHDRAGDPEVGGEEDRRPEEVGGEGGGGTAEAAGEGDGEGGGEDGEERQGGEGGEAGLDIARERKPTGRFRGCSGAGVDPRWFG
jgi:hypothetical protein